ncbi:MAG: hypothetical protein ABSG25_04155 [Bryobacteraceae bacterium]
MKKMIKNLLKETNERDISIALKELKTKQYQEQLKDDKYMNKAIEEVADWFI